MKIAILEEDHFEVLDVYLQIFQTVFGTDSVYLITNNHILDILESKIAKEKTLLTNGYNRNILLQKKITEFLSVNKIDIFLYNTIEVGEYIFANKLVKLINKVNNIKVILTLHNINTFLSPSWFVAKNPKRLYKNISNNINKLILFKRIYAFNVLCENQISYIKKLIGNRKPVFYTPPCILNSNSPIAGSKNITDKKKLTITILGGVDKNRKDFKTVLDALRLLGNTCKYFYLQIIGAAKGDFAKEVKNYLLQLANEFSLEFSFPESDQPILSNKQVSEILSKTDFLLCPTVPFAFYEGNKEYYGVSKSTGNFYDIIRYAKPAIFPEVIPVPFSLKKSVLSYSDSLSLSNLLRNLSVNLSLKNELDEAVIFAQETYALPKVAKSVQEQFSTIIQKP